MSSVGPSDVREVVETVLLVAQEPALVPRADGLVGWGLADDQAVDALAGHAVVACRSAESPVGSVTWICSDRSDAGVLGQGRHRAGQSGRGLPVRMDSACRAWGVQRSARWSSRR